MTKPRKSTLLPVILLIYLGGMSIIGYRDYSAGRTTPLFFYGVICVTLVVILLLHVTLRRRENDGK